MRKRNNKKKTTLLLSIAGAGRGHDFILFCLFQLGICTRIELSSEMLPSRLTSKKIWNINSNFQKTWRTTFLLLELLHYCLVGPYRAPQHYNLLCCYKKKQPTQITLYFNPKMTRDRFVMGYLHHICDKIQVPLELLQEAARSSAAVQQHC